MPTDAMLSIAAENLETKMDVIVEEQHRAGLIKPLHIWISEWVGLENLNKKEEFMEMLSVSTDRFDVCIILYLSSALSPTCHFLIPNLLSAEVFPNVSAISLHLLDLDGNEEGLQQQRRETEDLALRLLHQV